MIYVSDRETVGATIRADRTVPTKARRNEALAELAARADQEFAGVAGYSDLTDVQRQQLFKALLDAKRHFDFRRNIKAIPKDSAAIALLDNVAQSIIHTAKFGKTVLGAPPKTEDDPGKPPSPQGSKALRLLQRAGEDWAHEQRKAGNDLPNGFAAPWEAAPGVTNYGADIFIEDFLRTAHVMASIIKKAQQPPKNTGFEGWPANFQTGPIVWLAGEALPRIYSETFQRKFTATPANKDGAHTSNGIKFVRAACVALGLRSLDDQTIRSHWRKAREAYR